MNLINNNYDSNCKTLIKQPKESNSIKFKTPDFLRTSTELTSVVSIDTRDYLSLKCELTKKDLLEVDDWTIRNTIDWIDSLRKTVEYHELWWDEPIVNVDPSGEIVFEWWHESNKLTVYISEEEIEYIKVTGKDIDKDMQEGIISSFNEIELLWEWISLKDS